MSKKGFTLIELLIVIVIIGILSVAVVPRVLDYPKKARDATRKSDIAALNTAMGIYLSENSTFTGNKLNGCFNATAGQNLGKAIVSDLGGTLPKDPKPGKYGTATCDNYYYVVEKDASNTVTAYAFLAAMEVASNDYATPDFSSITVANLASTNGGKYYFVKQTL